VLNLQKVRLSKRSHSPMDAMSVTQPIRCPQCPPI